jgi:hypothetical protein
MLNPTSLSVSNALKPVMLCLLTLACSLPLVSLADDDEWRELHEQVKSGELLPLSQIIETLRRDYKGEVIEVELEDEDGVRLYEIELLGPDGQVVEFLLDAATGEIIGIEGTGINQMRRDP